MKKTLKINSPIVSVVWLNKNLSHPDLIVVDATIIKAVDKNIVTKSGCIQNARFLDIKTVFSDVSAPFPNTMLSAKLFEQKAQELGVNNDSLIIVYDQYGYYSSARVWWMFKTMGFENIAVLDGGLPNWIGLGYPTQKEHATDFNKGNFKSNFTHGMIHNHNKVLNSISDEKILVLDARSYDRFTGTKPEPREGLRSGHIPNSKILPYPSLLDGVKMKSSKELVEIFSEFKNKQLIFSCGSGITACILALGAEIVGIENTSVYDGSWTEWGSLTEFPIEK